VAEPWDLARSPEYFLDHVTELHRTLRERVYELVRRESTERLAAVTEQREGDTIFGIDVQAEEVLHAFFAAWGEELPLLLIAEGILGDGGRMYPEGTPRERAAFTCIVDPIDGTRGLMYGKRSAWILTGVASPPQGRLPTLADIRLAVQTELPTPRSPLSDVLWAVRGEGARAETHNLETGEVRPFSPRPSRADTLRYGFSTVSKFFPGYKVLASQIEERLFAELLGPSADGNPAVFDDEYLSTAGQLYELTVGHDRFIADLRPVLLRIVEGRDAPHQLCAHPYDLCTELIAREAGVVVTDLNGGPLSYSLDIRTDCGWLGYANEELRRQIEPVLRRILADL
jgi:fructose-1,6-bisphosphatase/inositol monophosphatase family enzyme